VHILHPTIYIPKSDRQTRRVFIERELTVAGSKAAEKPPETQPTP